jgi:excisionase family DNA binding protein
MESPLLRVQEAAALLRVSKWTIYRWIEEGRLRATKIGRGSLRIFRASLNGLIEGQCTDQAVRESNGRSQVVRVRSTLRASKRRT